MSRTDPGTAPWAGPDAASPVRARRRLPELLLLGLTVLASALLPGPVEAQRSSRDARDCLACHGELEFLRRQAGSMEEARTLLVPGPGEQGAAHAGESCADCHSGFDRWPHPERSRTETCASCHEEEHTLWYDGVHGSPDVELAEPATCSSCHTTHQVATLEEIREGPARDALDARCVSCHETQALVSHDVHLDSAGCASCHAPHDTRDVDDPRSWVAPLNQAETCGACHEDAGRDVPADAHGAALAEDGPGSLAALELLGARGAPTCTSCHDGHGMAAPADGGRARIQENCVTCHEDWADRYYGTYHGKATVLGSEIVASCADCHGGHGVLPASDAASRVHPGALVETCGECHEASRPAFVLYDSHPDPMDRERNAPLFYAFVFMNTILFSVLIVFGLHTLLWWVRILLDGRKEGHHA